MVDINKKPPLYHVAMNAMKAYKQANLTQYRRRQHEVAKKRKEEAANARPLLDQD